MNTTKDTARKVNTRPQQIAKFACGYDITTGHGSISVFLFETAGAPFYRLICNGGELPEDIADKEYATAREAVKVAADLVLCIIYDEVAEVCDEEIDETQNGPAA